CAGRGLNGGEERAVDAELEMADLRQQAGRKSVENVNLRGADDVCFRQSEVEVVRRVDAVELDLRRAGIGKGEGVAVGRGISGTSGDGGVRARRLGKHFG